MQHSSNSSAAPVLEASKQVGRSGIDTTGHVAVSGVQVYGVDQRINLAILK